MKIVNKFPPNYEEIAQVFDIKDRKGIVFTYGNTLYVPSGHKVLPQHLMVHEETHEKQQSEIGVKEWWDRYLHDNEFRLNQELEAYRNQYKYICETESRPQRRYLLTTIARDLSGHIYGNIISFERAKELISWTT